MSWNNQNQNAQPQMSEEYLAADRELGWDDEIVDDPTEFVLLPPGDYQFTVTEIERSRYDGGDKLPACNMAIVHCRFETSQGEAIIKNRLYLHTKTEGLLSAFFASIGLKKKGEPLRMQWGQAIGRQGMARVSQRPYEGEKYNEIRRFLLPADYDNPAASTATGWGAGKY